MERPGGRGYKREPQPRGKASPLTRPRRSIVSALALCAGLAALGAHPARAADAAHGLQLFRQTCGVCHLALRNATRNDAATKIGPNLFGVVGRRAGSVMGFRYSPAMRGSGVVWTPDMLRRYIQAPQKTIPNVRMAFPGMPNPRDADDVVAYLETLK